MVNSPKRGEVWIVEFDQTRGAELRKTRPSVVISSDEVSVLPIKLVAQMTGWKDSFANNVWHVRIDPTPRNGLNKTSAVDALQIRSVATERFLDRIGIVSNSDVMKITDAIAAVIEHQG